MTDLKPEDVIWVKATVVHADREGEVRCEVIGADGPDDKVYARTQDILSEAGDDNHIVNTYYSICHPKPEPGCEVRSFGSKDSAQEHIPKFASVMGLPEDQYHILEVTVRRHYRVL